MVLVIIIQIATTKQNYTDIDTEFCVQHSIGKCLFKQYFSYNN